MLCDVATGELAACVCSSFTVMASVALPFKYVRRLTAHYSLGVSGHVYGSTVYIELCYYWSIINHVSISMYS